MRPSLQCDTAIFMSHTQPLKPVLLLAMLQPWSVYFTDWISKQINLTFYKHNIGRKEHAGIFKKKKWAQIQNWSQHHDWGLPPFLCRPLVTVQNTRSDSTCLVQPITCNSDEPTWRQRTFSSFGWNTSYLNNSNVRRCHYTVRNGCFIAKVRQWQHRQAPAGGKGQSHDKDRHNGIMGGPIFSISEAPLVVATSRNLLPVWNGNVLLWYNEMRLWCFNY